MRSTSVATSAAALVRAKLDHPVIDGDAHFVEFQPAFADVREQGHSDRIARLQVGLGSDIGHWDVPDTHEPLVEAFELVERDVLLPEQFREFTFDNQDRFYASGNPTFFDGSTVAAEARAVLASNH